MLTAPAVGRRSPSSDSSRWVCAGGSRAEVLLTTDEFNWVLRSERFATAIRTGDLAAASADPVTTIATRPGLTTLWIGFGAQKLEAPVGTISSWLHLGDGPSMLRLAHLLMALVCTMGLIAFTVLARRVVGRRAGLVAGALLAVEPILVGHSAVLHTDALVATFGAVAVLAFVAAVEARARAGPSPGWRPDEAQWLAAAGGAAAGIALLTKVNAVAILVPAMAIFVILALAPRRSAGGEPAPLGTRARDVVAAVLTCGVVMVALWPSLWVEPLAQIQATRDSAGLAGDWIGGSFFFGEVHDTVDRRFYPVAAWYRLSGWMLIAIAAACITWVVTSLRHVGDRLPRRVTLQLWVPPLVYTAVIAVSDKHYDRYLLPLLPFVALGIGCMAVRATAKVDGFVSGAIGWTAFGVAAIWTSTLAPFAISHVDPLVGGQRAAAERIPLGWGEGIETVMARIPRAPGECPSISSRRWLIAQAGCFVPQDFAWLDGSTAPPDYVVIYIGDRQLGNTVKEERVLAERGTLVDKLELGGETYVELWTVDDTSTGPTG